MSEQKWTPGPWRIQQYTNHIGWAVYSITQGCIAERWYNTDAGYANEELRANAHLIAAAPELYEALERGFNQLVGPAYIAAVAALTKARGEAK